MQENSKCWRCCGEDKIIHHVISKCCKLAQKQEQSQLGEEVNQLEIEQETEI